MREVREVKKGLALSSVDIPMLIMGRREWSGKES